MPSSQSDLLRPPRPGPPPRPRVPHPERWVLANGLRVLAITRRGLPQVVVRLVVPAGSAADPPGFEGTASLVGSLLTEGTAELSAAAFNTRVDHLGAALEAHVGHDFADIEILLLPETVHDGLALLADAVLRPAFPTREFERVRAETLDGIAARWDDPGNLADDRAAVEVFGPAHPYGRPSWGTAESVRGVSRQVVTELHGNRCRPDGSFLVACGDFDLADLRVTLERVFAPWRGSAPQSVVPASQRLPLQAGASVEIGWEDASQSEIRVVGVGVARSSPDWIPAALANYILGGSTITGRLGANLREDKGWTYGVRSAFAEGLQPAGWGVETAVDVDVGEDAVAEILGELRRIAEEPVSGEELRRAKDALILSLPRAFETPGRVVHRLAALEAHGLTEDYWESLPARLESVSAEDILRVASEYFAPERLVSVRVGTDDEGDS